MRTSMKSIAAALSAAMFCLMSCVNLSTGDGNQNNGGNPKDDTPSSKDDEPKKDDAGDVYVLESVDCEYVGKDGTRSSYRCFEKPVYITPEWSNVPVLQSYTLRDAYHYSGTRIVEYEYVYLYPSKVLLYESAEEEPSTFTFGSKGLIESVLDDNGIGGLRFQYDSDGRLAKITYTYHDGSTVENYFFTFSYDSHSRLSEIEETTDVPDNYGFLVTFEYSSIPSKNSYPLQLVLPGFFLSELLEVNQGLVMSGLMGKSFSDCLLKSMKLTDYDEEYNAGEEYSYVLDANGYVKEMKTRIWEDGNNGGLTTLSSSFEWKRL